MEPRDLSELNKMLILIDNFDEPEDPEVLAGVALNIEDLEPFIADVEKLAMEKYGGRTFAQLLDEDIDDTVIDAAGNERLSGQLEDVYRQACKIIKFGESPSTSI